MSKNRRFIYSKGRGRRRVGVVIRPPSPRHIGDRQCSMSVATQRSSHVDGPKRLSSRSPRWPLSAFSRCLPPSRLANHVDRGSERGPDENSSLRGEKHRDSSLKTFLTRVRRRTTERTRGDTKLSKYRQKRPSTTCTDGPIPFYTQQVGGSSPSAPTTEQNTNRDC
jgi:hypothetical protein